MKNKKIWIDIHQICGDCGRRTKLKVDLEKNDLKTVLKLIKSYYPKGNMACSRCSAKK